MNTFRIVEFNYRMDESLNYDYINSGGHSIQVPKVELTLIPVNTNDNFLFKLANISSKNRTITINDTEYADYLEPFKKEFIEFMNEKYPEKILADRKSWDCLREN